jgi:hypothetical protein
VARWEEAGSRRVQVILNRAEAASLIQELTQMLLFQGPRIPSVIFPAAGPYLEIFFFVEKQRPTEPGISRSEEPPTLPLWADSPRDR